VVFFTFFFFFGMFIPILHLLFRRSQECFPLILNAVLIQHCVFKFFAPGSQLGNHRYVATGRRDDSPCLDRNLVREICTGNLLPNINRLPLRKPDVFIAGQLHQFLETWEQVTTSSSYDQADEVLDWIKHSFRRKIF